LSSAPSDTAVVCARFQPPHRGHFNALEEAARRHTRVLVVVLGADDATSLRSPWSFATRRGLLEAGAGRPLEVFGLRDVRYERERWRHDLATLVGAAAGPAATLHLWAERAPRSELPPWPRGWRPAALPVRFSEGENLLRALLFWRAGHTDWPSVDPILAPATRTLLRAACGGEDYGRLCAEAAYLRAFKAGWDGAPYPPVFVTVDALVTWRERVLLIERARAPGAGLLALPGGFVDPRETLEVACLRELREETGLDLAAHAPVPVQVFDDPYRSLRGRTITHVFHYRLDALPEPPAVHCGDDARAAAWHLAAALTPAHLFEDHYAILQRLLGLA